MKDFENGICENCTGIKGCTRYCPRRVGKAIVTFLKSTGYMITPIGEIKPDLSERYGGGTYVVTGYDVESGLAGTSTIKEYPESGIKLQDKLSSYNGVSPADCIREYAKEENTDNESLSKALSMLEEFNRKNTVIIGVRIGAEIELIGTNKSEAFVKSLHWEIDPDSGELCGYIITYNRADQYQAYKSKLALKDYMVTWRLPNIDVTLTTDELTSKAIECTSLGLIKPVEIITKDYKIAVDGYNMYYTGKAGCSVVGQWKNGKIALSPDMAPHIRNTKAYKKIAYLERLLDKHRKMIIPYGLSESNRIEV